MDESRVVRLRTAAEIARPPFRFGSGCLVTPERVLTAAHVLCQPGVDAGDPVPGTACEVLPWGADPQHGWLPAQVEVVVASLDLAVVQVPRFAAYTEPMRMGGLPEDSTPVPWRAIGFPLAGMDDTGRQPETVWGEVSPTTQSFAGRLGLVVASRRPRVTASGASGWAGLSGAGVFSGELLVGVVTEDPAGFSGSLIARRLDRAGDPELLAALGSPVFESLSAGPESNIEWLRRNAETTERAFMKHLGCNPGDPVARLHYLDVLVRPRPDVPAGTPEPPIRADDLAEYMAQPGVRFLLLGPGGAGKSTVLTRTARDLAQAAAADRHAPLVIYSRLNFFDTTANGFEELIGIIARSVSLAPADAEQLWLQSRRRCVFLLDGYNEVGASSREACELALGQLLQQSFHSYVVSSRPGGEAERLALRLGMVRLAMESLDDEQVDRFLDGYGLSGRTRAGSGMRALIRTPFLLRAYAESQSAMPGVDAPSSAAGLLARLIDGYIFTVREQSKSGEARPTRYHYERVKKPILAEVAVRMCVDGLTRRSQDTQLLTGIRDELHAICARYEGIYPVAPYELMPYPPVALDLIDECVRNGILVREQDTLEFPHELIRDYFAGSAIIGWPVAEATALVKPLVWRHVVPEFFGDSLDPSGYGPLVMAVGQHSRPAELVCALVNHHPVVAARCHAEAPTTTGANYLTAVLRPLLFHPDPVRRWVACACVGLAELRDPELLTILADIACSEDQSQVRTAAARAIGRTGHEDTIRQIVTWAMADTRAERYNDESGHQLQLLQSPIAVREVFAIWREARGRTPRGVRAQQLLATMNPFVVAPTLRAAAAAARLDKDSRLADDCQAALDGIADWERTGVVTPDYVSYKHMLAQQHHVQNVDALMAQWAGLTPAELTKKLPNPDTASRTAAARLLGGHDDPETLDPLLDALAVETNGWVRRALLESLRSLARQPAFASSWSSRLTVNRSPVAELAPSLANSLVQGDLLKGEIISELAAQGITIDRAVVYQIEGFWEVRPTSWGGDLYLNDPLLRIIQAGEKLPVYDLGRLARLVSAGAPLGDAAIPALAGLRDDPAVDVFVPAMVEVLDAIGTVAAIESLCSLIPQALACGERSMGGVLKVLAAKGSASAITPLVDALRTLTIVGPYAGASRSQVVVLAELDEYELRSFDSLVQDLVTAILAAGGETALANLVEQSLSSDGDIAQYVAVHAIAHASTMAQAGELLDRALGKDSPQVRAAAARAIGRRDNPNHLPLLIDLCVQDESQIVRSAAAEAIRWCEGDGGITTLTRHLTDINPIRVARAADALGIISDTETAPALRALLDKSPPRRGAEQVAAVRALRLLRAPVPIETSLALLSDVARTGVDVAERTAAMEELLEAPGGRERLLAPVHAALDQKAFQEALRTLDDDALLATELWEVRWLRAVALRGLGRLDAALSELDHVLPQLADWASGFNYRTNILFELGRAHEALEAHRGVAAKHPDDTEWYAGLGWWAYVAGLLDESVGASNRAVDLEPKNLASRLNLGLALAARGDSALAIGTYRQAVRIARESEKADSLDWLKVAIKELDELAQTKDGTDSAIVTAREILQDTVNDLAADARNSS